MTKSWQWLLALALAAPAWAQEEPAAEQPAEVVPVEEPGAADEAAPAEESAEAPAEEPTAEDTASEETASEDSEASSGGEPWVLYGGADLVTSFLSPSGPSGPGGQALESGFYRLHFGARPFENLNVEAQLGIHEGSFGPGEYRSESYVGAFLVPHVDALWIFDVAFPVGYANTAAKLNAANKHNLHSVAYGLEAALPLRSFSENAPDFRFTFGGMVYYQKSDARIYGYHLGLNYAFGG